MKHGRRWESLASDDVTWDGVENCRGILKSSSLMSRHYLQGIPPPNVRSRTTMHSAREWNRKTTMAACGRSTILPYQLEPTSTVADSESDTTNSISDDSSDSDVNRERRWRTRRQHRLVLVPPLRYGRINFKSFSQSLRPTCTATGGQRPWLKFSWWVRVLSRETRVANSCSTRRER